MPKKRKANCIGSDSEHEDATIVTPTAPVAVKEHATVTPAAKMVAPEPPAKRAPLEPEASASPAKGDVPTPVTPGLPTTAFFVIEIIACSS